MQVKSSISKLLRYELTTIFTWDPLKYTLMISDFDHNFKTMYVTKDFIFQVKAILISLQKNA